MMVYWILALVALFAGAQAARAPDCKNCTVVGKDERAMFRAHSEACIPQSRAEPRLVDSLLRGEPVDEPALRRHVYCVLRRCKLIGKDGKPLKAAALGKVAARAEAKNATEVLESCASQPGDTPEDLAWKLFRCGYGKKAVLFHRMPTPSAGADNDAV